MIVADSSVWIDFLGGTIRPSTNRLDAALADQSLVLLDVVATEVLQGLRSDRDVSRTMRLFESLQSLEIGGLPLAMEAARNYRRLRALGVTPRKTIDTLIATRCIADNIPLLYNDRHFDPFVAHLGLISPMDR